MVPPPTSLEEVRMTTFDADAKNDLGHTTDGRVTSADNGRGSSDPVDNAPDAVAMSESALAEAARKVADNPEVKLALQAVVDLAMANCGCEGASVTLVGANGGAESTATSSNLIAKADDLQYAYDEGPCLRAAEDGGAFLILDTRTDPRFPVWGPDVANLGLNSVLSIHLFTDHRILGALNLYYEARDDFTPDEVEVAKVVAAHASVALAKLRSERDLWRAIDSRHLIGQAQGILMERFKLGPEKAFSVLRRYSQQHNIKLHEVAGELIRTGKLPAGPIPAPTPDDPTIAG
jgi:GAF domain-containing protein